MHGFWSRFFSLALIVTILIPTRLASAAANTFLYPSASSRSAFQASLNAYNARHAADYSIVLFWEAGGLAYASATRVPADSEDILVLLGTNSGLDWTVLIPGESPAVEYNRLLATFPDPIIDETTKALLTQRETPAGQTAQSAALANYSSHKLPWPYGKTAYVTQKDTASHMYQIDFDIQGLAASGDVYASKPGTVVFVKQSSNTTCSTPAPDPCWKKSNMVVVQHASGEYSWYVHLVYNSVPVTVGQNIGFGTKIGVEGRTGYSTGVHLHYMASSGHTAWTTPSNPNDAPWATGINPVDFDEYSWANLIQTYSSTYTSQNAANLPMACPSAGGVLLFRDSTYQCAGQSENYGYVLRTGLGFQNLPASMDESASSLLVPAGQSILLYQNANRGELTKCISAPGDDNFANDTFDNSTVSLDNQVSSFQVFPSSGCPVRTATDLTAPTGSFSSPAAGATMGRFLPLTASASDAQSGVQFVRFSAAWSGQSTRLVYTAAAAPYTYTWDLCAAGVPDGDITLSLEIIDKAWNSFTAPAIHVNKSDACAAPAGTAWSADYFDNPGLTGVPASHQDESTVYLFHNWGSAAPGTGLPADGWSARFTRSVDFPGGDYRFHCQSSDGCRVIIDGQARIASWQDNDFAGYDWIGTLSAGSHAIQAEYYDNTGDARLELWWQGPGFLPRDAACDSSQWCLDVFGNPTLAGTAAIHRNEGETLAHTWGSLPPDPLLPALPFSTRAVRSARFDCGTYRLHASTSGGLRLWFDNVIKIDQWTEPTQATEYTADVSSGTAPGLHALKVEHFENSVPASLSVWWEKLSSCTTATTVEYASEHYVRQGAPIEPSLRVRVTSGYLDPARGDRLVLVAGSALSAPTSLPVRSFVNTGETYTFDPTNGFSMTAPAADGKVSPASQWNLLASGSYTGTAVPINVTVDSQAPQVSVTAPTGYLTANTITIQAGPSDATSGISHTQFFAGYNTGSGWSWHSLGYDLNGSDGWSIVWNATSIPDQTGVKFFVQAWDRAGNGNGNWTNSLTLDRTPPAATITPLAATQDSTRFLVQWAITDNLTGIDHWDLQYKDGASNWTDWLLNQKGSARSAWFTGVLNHDYAFRIRAGDPAGNLGSYPADPPTVITHVNTCTANDFEPDNDKDHARAIQVDGSAEIHKICGAGDQDWFVLTTEAGSGYIIYTNQLGATTDTYLTLFKSDGVTMLANNDNANSTSLASGVAVRSADGGALYIRIRHADTLVAGDAVTYNLSVVPIRASLFMPLIFK
jgi:hypothetical protein